MSASSSEAAATGVPGHSARPAVQPASWIGLQRVVQVRRRLRVDRDVVGARLGEGGDVALRPLDHQVDVEERAGGVDLLGQRLDDERAHRDRRHEVAVHDVDVDRRARPRPAPRRPGRPGARSRPPGSTARRRAGGAQIGWSIELRQWLQAYRAVSDIRTIVECSPQFGHTEQQLEAVQAVHAAVAAREVGRAQPRLVAGRADVAEVDVVVAAHVRRSRAMKNPSVPSRCGSVCWKLGTLGWSQTGRSDGGSSSAKSAWRSRKASIRRSFSVRRDRAGGVDEDAAGAERRGARRRGSRPGASASSATAAASLRQRASGREASVPRSEHGGSTSTRS